MGIAAEGMGLHAGGLRLARIHNRYRSCVYTCGLRRLGRVVNSQAAAREPVVVARGHPTEALKRPRRGSGLHPVPRSTGSRCSDLTPLDDALAGDGPSALAVYDPAFAPGP
jgi:hypothetical protein